jgi:glycosyltransferase involved in cell wall biosynthesis
MKVLFDHPNPFLLAHGGFQIQIEQTKCALEEIGVEVEWLSWWDSTQSGDIIHYFGRPSGAYIDFAHQKGIMVVMSELLTGLGSRSASQRRLQKCFTTLSQKLLPSSFTAKLAWEAYQKADAIVALTPWEKQLMVEMFDASLDNVHVIPNGVEEVFFQRTPNQELRTARSDYLVCTATITERKRVLDLSEAAILAKKPVWVIGNPYSEQDPYYLRFLQIVKESEGMVRYEGGISDRQRLADIYRSARGFVLLSTMESLSLSALEAAASGCPLLLSDLPWARSSFGEHARFCPDSSVRGMSHALRQFYDLHRHPSSLTPARWQDVATSLRDLYQAILR